MLQEILQHLFEVQEARLVINQRHHVHTKVVLQLGALVQIVKHYLRHFTALKLDDNAHSRFIGFIPQIRNAFNFFLIHQLSNTLKQVFLIYLVRQLVDDDGLARAFIQILKMGLGSHDHATTAGAIAFAHPLHAVNNSGSRKIRRWNNLD